MAVPKPVPPYNDRREAEACAAKVIHPMTKAGFLAAYAEQLTIRYPHIYGARPTPPSRSLSYCLDRCRETLAGASTWAHSVPAARDAWRDIGCRTRITLKALRALPEGEA